MPADHAPLAMVLEVARPTVERVVWATVATVDPHGRPRTRLLHPVWWWDDGPPTALVAARPTPIKRAHLAVQRDVSCFYWDPQHDTVAIDAAAEWVADDERASAWERIAAVPPPVGFDPSLIWPGGSSAADCAFIRLAAHRIVATPAGRPGSMWVDPSASAA